MKLMIVDDSRVSRMMIRGKVLAQHPEWQVIEAACGEDAVALALAERPDCITMDINMPGMTGFDAIRRLRQGDVRARIVVLTANIQESSRERADELGVHFVAKPVTQRAVQQAIDHFTGP